MRLFVAQQEEKDWQDVEQWAQDLQEHEEEQKRAWDLLEKNKKLIQAEKERSDVADAAHYEELVRKARAQLDEEKAQRVRDAEDRKSSSSSVKPVPKSKPKPKPIVLKEANFQFDCVWSIGHNQFLVHRVGFDQLGTLSIEKEYKGFREKMQNSYHLLYPFKNAKCGLALQKIAPQFNWYEFWIKPLSSFPNLPPSLESFITAEREGVLKECCEAFWPTSDDEVFLVHFAFFPCRQRNSLLSVAFHLVEKNLCPSLFDSYQRRLIMMPDVVARYPWRNGDDGVALLEENSSDIHLTYQELKIMKNERN